MKQSIEERLISLGLSISDASTPAAQYTNFVIVKGLLYISGKGPSGDPRGKLGKEFKTEEGYIFARQAGLEVLAVVKSALGTLNKVRRVVKIQGFVNATSEYEEHHLVLNGCSDLMIEVFGDQGTHARSVFGATSLRSGLPVIVDSIFEVEE